MKILARLEKLNQKSNGALAVPELFSYKSDKVMAEIMMADVGTDLTQLLCQPDSNPMKLSRT